MNRLRDYARFAVWFVGLGYMAIWPLSANGTGGAMFGAPILCHASAPFVLGMLCHAPHPLKLPPAMHALGLLSAVAVALWLLCRALRRIHCLRAVHIANLRALQIRARPMRASRPSPRLPRIKQRSQFGLRGTQR